MWNGFLNSEVTSWGSVEKRMKPTVLVIHEITDKDALRQIEMQTLTYSLILTPVLKSKSRETRQYIWQEKNEHSVVVEYNLSFRLLCQAHAIVYAVYFTSPISVATPGEREMERDVKANSGEVGRARPARCQNGGRLSIPSGTWTNICVDQRHKQSWERLRDNCWE